MIKRGFSLIEILVVVSILGILSLMGVLVFNSNKSFFLLSGETRDLVGNIRYAQQLSVTEQIEYSIYFDFLNNSYQIIKHGEEDLIISDKKISQQVILEEIDNYTEARFNPYGAVKKSGKIKLKIEESEKIIDIRPSGILAKRKINFGMHSSFEEINIEGIIYSNDQIGISSVPDVFNIKGAIIGRKLDFISLWSGINITLDNDIILYSLGYMINNTPITPTFSPVVNIEHWEEAY
jgi:prepilin-type N-terminal cleavage/methylation domain-containing protein